MKEIKKSELVNLLNQPLAEENMGASEIILLRDSFQKPIAGFVPGNIMLPIQYATGVYNLVDKKKPINYQQLVTVFHPDFFEGKTLENDRGELWRPLADGYLDVNYPEDYAYENVSDKAYEFRRSLWIGEETEDDAEKLVLNHLNKLSDLYKFGNHLKEPAEKLIENAFSKYDI